MRAAKPMSVKIQAMSAGPGEATCASWLMTPKMPVPIAELTMRAARPRKPMAGFRPAALGASGPETGASGPDARPGETGTLVLDADAAGVAAVVPCAVMMSLSRKCLSVSWRGKPDGSESTRPRPAGSRSWA